MDALIVLVEFCSFNLINGKRLGMINPPLHTISGSVECHFAIVEQFMTVDGLRSRVVCSNVKKAMLRSRLIELGMPHDDAQAVCAGLPDSLVATNGVMTAVHNAQTDDKETNNTTPATD